MSTLAYLYKWTNTTNKKWYVGSRTKEGCHPDDGYICSSKIKSEILTEQKNWVREILAIGNSTYIRNLEANFLVLLDAKNDPLSYNKHNGDGKFTTAGKKDTTETRLKKSVAHTGKHIGVNNNFYGKKHSIESIEKSKRVGADNGMFGKKGILSPIYGVIRTNETRLKIAEGKKGNNHPSRKIENRRVCEYCNLELSKSNYVRWHGIKCKKGINHE